MDIVLGMSYNSFTRLKQYFGIDTLEMLEFWGSLTPEEQKEWREADLYD